MRGRPKKKEEEKKMKVLNIRITEEEKRKLEEKIKKDLKYESISQFIRHKIREYINE